MLIFYNFNICRLHLAIPPSTSKGAFKYSQCLRYDVNFTSLVDENGTLSLTPNPNWPVKRCDKGWEYDYSEIPYPSATVEVKKLLRLELIYLFFESYRNWCLNILK